MFNVVKQMYFRLQLVSNAEIMERFTADLQLPSAE